MKKLCFLTTLLICLNLPLSSYANTETHNWCGIYFEQNNQGFIRIPMIDIHHGSSSCNLEDYALRARTTGTANIAISITKNRSDLGYWRKFDNHLIEIRGKLKHGEFTRTRLIHDLGI